MYYNLDIIGLENIPNEKCIFAPNHQSFIDGFIVSAALPDEIYRKTFYLGKEDHFRSGFRKSDKLSNVG